MHFVYVVVDFHINDDEISALFVHKIMNKKKNTHIEWSGP